MSDDTPETEYVTDAKITGNGHDLAIPSEIDRQRELATRESATLRITPTPDFVEIIMLEGGALLVNTGDYSFRIEPGRKMLVFGDPVALPR